MTDPNKGSSNTKRLLFLAGIAVFSIALAAYAVVQSNREEQQRQEQAVKPATNQPADNPLENPSKGGTGDAASGSSGDAGDQASTNALDAPEFPGNPNPNRDYPVTSGSGSKKPKSATEQKTGEQILADIAEGSVGLTLNDRTKALLKAKTAFNKSIAADPRNEAAYYGLSYTNVNLAGGYQVTKTKKDDAQIKPLMNAAFTQANRSLTIAQEDGNPVIVELAKNLVKGITPFLKKK